MRCTIFFMVMLLFSGVLLAQNDSLSNVEEAQQALEAAQQNVDQYEEGEETEEGQSETEEGEEHTLVEPDALEGTIEYKAEKVAVRKFDKDKWKAIVGSTAYEEEPEDKPKEKEKDESISTPWNSELLRGIAFVFIIAIVVALLYYLLKNISIETKLKKKSFQVDDFVAHVENIEDLDIETLLQQTLAQGNLRLAIRLYYLGLLKKLNDVELIMWKRNKTNRDYLSELFSKDFYFEEVKKLTSAYEQVWYGEHTLTQESFQKLSHHFETVHQKLNMIKSL